MAFQLHSVVSQTGMYKVYCEQLFNLHNQTIDCDHLSEDPFAEDEVQQSATHWNMVIALAHLLPSLITYVLLGAWGDKHGRKINILLGTTISIVAILPQIYIFQYPETNLWIYVSVQFFIGCFGSAGLIMISSFAYLADTVENKDNLTVRMMIYSLVSTTSSIIGASLASKLMQILSFTYILVLGQLMMLISFLYALIRLKQIPPSELRKSDRLIINDAHVSELTDDIIVADKVPILESTGKLCKCNNGLRVLKDDLELVKSVWHTYTKIRTGKGRTYLLLLTAVYGVYLIGEMGKGLTTLYFFRSLFSWTGVDVGYYKSVGMVLTFMDNLIGAFNLKKFFKFREITIILLALMSGVANLITLGVSSESWMLWLALSLGSFGSLFLPTVKSLTSQIVNEDEVGKSFVAYGFTADVAIIVNVIASNSIYSATVGFFPGFIFLLCAGFILTGFVGVLWIHVDLIVAIKKGLVIDDEITDDHRPFF